MRLNLGNEVFCVGDMLPVGKLSQVALPNCNRMLTVTEVKGVNNALIQKAVFVVRLFTLSNFELLQSFLWLVQITERCAEISSNVSSICPDCNRLSIISDCLRPVFLVERCIT